MLIGLVQEKNHNGVCQFWKQRLLSFAPVVGFAAA